MSVSRTSVGASPPSGRLPDLGIRAASGLGLVVVALGATLVGGLAFGVAWALAGVAVLFEWQRLVGGSRLVARVVVGSLGVILVAVLGRGGGPDALWPLVLSILAVGALAGPDRRLWAASGMAYAGLFVLAIFALRFSHPDGARSVIWLFAVVWATDVFAYFGGRLIGGPKLWPRVSPSKTWSGTLTGVAVGAAVGTFVALREHASPTALAPMLALTLAAAVLSQAGDALESGIKRRFGVKDTGRLIPGHGGLMDRLDGFIAAAVFAYGFGLLRGLPSVASGLLRWG